MNVLDMFDDIKDEEKMLMKAMERTFEKQMNRDAHSMFQDVMSRDPVRGELLRGLDKTNERFEDRIKNVMKLRGCDEYLFDVHDIGYKISTDIVFSDFAKTFSPEERMYILPNSCEEMRHINRELLSPLDYVSARAISGGYVMLNDEFLKDMAEMIGDKKCLEVMSGNGFFSYALEQHGVSPIICTDVCTDLKADDMIFHDIKHTVAAHDIHRMDAVEAIKTFGKEVDFVICSWPPYDEPIASMCIEQMHQINPDARMIYIGEWRGGCTADDAFFNLIDDDDRYEKFVCDRFSSTYYTLYGLHDAPYVLQYKE